MNSKRLVLLFAAIVFFPFSVNANTVSGTYSGIFINPSPSSPPSVTTGIGTDSISWGIPCDGVTNCYTSPGGITPPSSFAFTPVPFSTEVGEPFILGELAFYNGTIMPGTEISQVTLYLNGFQITPTQFAGSDSRVISIVNTPNNADPIASADRATIPMAFFPAANEFGVLESQSSVATILGIFKEPSPDLLDLTILGYGEAKDSNGFLDGFAPNPVPVPSAVWLFGSSLLGLAGVAKRKRRGVRLAKVCAVLGARSKTH